MKNILFIFILLTGINSAITAQFKPVTTEATRDSAKLAIAQLTTEWNNAIIHRDSLTLDKILSPEYTLNGAVDRTKWMNNTLHHFTTDSMMILSPLNITFYDDAMRSEGTFFWKASYDGIPRINAEYLITDIWVKRNNHWQVLIRLSSLLKNR